MQLLGEISPCSRYLAINASSTSTTWSTSAPCARLTDEKSDSPSGLKKQSTTRLPPPAGRLIGRHSLPEERLDRREQGRQIGILDVDLVDDDEAAEDGVWPPSPSSSRQPSRCRIAR
jgi:hypothetical protein